MKVLVAYASRHGATGGIADRIATTLEGHGYRVTLEPVERVADAAAHDAFVIGSAAYMGHWIKEASRFVREHRSLLAARPVWLFSSGPIGTETVDEKGRDVIVASEPQEFREFAEALHPRDMRVFFGAYDPDAPPVGLAEQLMERFSRLAPAVREALPSGDFRDWPAIEAWADGIAGELDRVRQAEAAPA